MKRLIALIMMIVALGSISQAQLSDNPVTENGRIFKNAAGAVTIDWESLILTGGVWQVTGEATNGNEIVNYQTMTNQGYLTAEADTLQTVTDRGATTTNALTISGLTQDDYAIDISGNAGLGPLFVQIGNPAEYGAYFSGFGDTVYILDGTYAISADGDVAITGFGTVTSNATQTTQIVNYQTMTGMNYAVTTNYNVFAESNKFNDIYVTDGKLIVGADVTNTYAPRIKFSGQELRITDENDILPFMKLSPTERTLQAGAGTDFWKLNYSTQTGATDIVSVGWVQGQNYADKDLANTFLASQIIQGDLLITNTGVALLTLRSEDLGGDSAINFEHGSSKNWDITSDYATGDLIFDFGDSEQVLVLDPSDNEVRIGSLNTLLVNAIQDTGGAYNIDLANAQLGDLLGGTQIDWSPDVATLYGSAGTEWNVQSTATSGTHIVNYQTMTNKIESYGYSVGDWWTNKPTTLITATTNSFSGSSASLTSVDGTNLMWEPVVDLPSSAGYLYSADASGTNLSFNPRIYGEIYTTNGSQIASLQSNVGIATNASWIGFTESSLLSSGVTTDGTNTLKVATAGDYEVCLDGSFEASGAVDTHAHIYTSTNNGVTWARVGYLGTRRDIANANDFGDIGKNGYIALIADTWLRVGMYADDATGGETITFHDFNLHCNRLD